MVMSPKSSVDISGGKIAHFTEEVDAHLTSRRFLDMIVTQSGQPLLRADPSKLELNQGSSLTAAANEVVYEILPSSFALTQFTGKDATGNLVVNNLPQPSFANGVDPTCSRSCGHQFVDIAGDNGTQQDLDKRHIFDMYISQTHIKVYENGKLYDDTDLAKPLTYSQLQMNFTHEVYHTANEINEQKDGSTRNSYFYDYRPFSDERHWDNMGQEVLASWTQAVPTIEPIVAPQFVSGQPTPAPTMSLSGGLCLNLRLSNLPNGTSVNPSISVKILDSAGTAVAVTTGQSLASGSINLTDPTFLSLLNDLSTYSIVVKPTGYLAEQLNSATHLLTSCQSLPVAFIPGDMLDSNHLGLAELVTLIRAFNGSGNSETSATYPAGPKIGDIVSFIRAFNQSVSISSFAFSQPTMTVGVGASVNWLNNETTAITHTVTSTDGTGFDSGFISAGTSFSKTFSQAGTYTYHCSRHPSMTGKVIVQ